MAHALEIIVDAAEQLANYKEIIFLFVGGGASKKNLDQYIHLKKY